MMAVEYVRENFYRRAKLHNYVKLMKIHWQKIL